MGAILIPNPRGAVLTYVSVSATRLGSSPGVAFYFVSFANAGSLFGRLTAGLLADRLGLSFFCLHSVIHLI